MWVAPTAILTAWRDCLRLCPSIIAAGNTLDQFQYPEAALVGAVFPLYLLAEGTAKRVRIADGVHGLRAGQLSCMFYLPLSTFPTAAECETFARNVQDELWNPTLINVTPVPAFQEMSTDLASDPPAGQRASSADPFRTIRLIADCGLNR